MIAKNMKEWHKAVTSRDNYICQLQISPDCKKDYSFPIYLNENGENNYVCGDHLKPRNVAPELKLETTNGKCVCRLCHALRDYKDLPEGYLEPAIEPMETTTYTGKEKNPILSVDAFKASCSCKSCKKYRANNNGLCSQCQPWEGHQLKLSKPKKPKK